MRVFGNSKFLIVYELLNWFNAPRHCPCDEFFLLFVTIPGIRRSIWASYEAKKIIDTIFFIKVLNLVSTGTKWSQNRDEEKPAQLFTAVLQAFNSFFIVYECPKPNGNNLKALMLVSGQPFWRDFVRNRWESEKFPLYSPISGNSNSIKQKASTKFLSQLGFKQMNLGVPKSGKKRQNDPVFDS